MLRLTSRKKGLLVAVGAASILLALWTVFPDGEEDPVDRVDYTELVRLAREGLFRDTPSEPLVLADNRLTGRYFDVASQSERAFEGIFPHESQQAMADMLVSAGATVTVKDGEEVTWFHRILTVALPMLILVGFLYFLLNRQLKRGGQGGLHLLGKSRARLWTKVEGRENVTFQDVAGADEAKEELQEIIEFLREPDRFRRLGGQIPRGVLLTGPPGTGKTLLARAVAGEANVPFFSVNGTEFVEMYVGVGASRVRDLFETGRQHAPCIIFVDEIDAIGRRRGTGLGSGHDEREQALNQLLSEMDGFERKEGVILIGATNRPDVLDPALLRPGRFDRHVVVGLPDVRGREGILRVHLRRIPLAEDVEIPLLARATSGFSGAQLESMVNEAAIRGARLDREAVMMVDFLEEKDRSLMGRERRSMFVSAKDRLAIAYREAGRALVAWSLPETDPVYKVTIVPRGTDLGTTTQVPDEARYTSTKVRLESAIAVLMARRCAEEVFLGGTTSAVSEDLRIASALARQMVCEWGMDMELGPLSYGPKSETVFLGSEMGRPRQYGEETSTRIDGAVKKIVQQGYREARRILEDLRSTVVHLAEALQEYETLDLCQLEAIIESEGSCR